MNNFDKTRRLLTKQQYEYVFNQAKKVVMADFVLLYRANTVGHARLGLALSKKAIAKAHDRNRVKRMIRETFRVRTQLPAIDVIVLAKFGVAKTNNSVMMNKLSQAWNRLAVLHGK